MLFFSPTRVNGSLSLSKILSELNIRVCSTLCTLRRTYNAFSSTLLNGCVLFVRVRGSVCVLKLWKTRHYNRRIYVSTLEIFIVTLFTNKYVFDYSIGFEKYFSWLCLTNLIDIGLLLRHIFEWKIWIQHTIVSNTTRICFDLYVMIVRTKIS